MEFAIGNNGYSCCLNSVYPIIGLRDYNYIDYYCYEYYVPSADGTLDKGSYLTRWFFLKTTKRNIIKIAAYLLVKSWRIERDLKIQKIK